MIFTGSATALVTPFSGDGLIDEAAFCNLIDRQIQSGSSAVVVLGTTGENATITPKERSRLSAIAVEQVAGRVPLIIGTGNNSTSESIAFSVEADRLGADGLLVVGPYYNKPPQRGFKAHVAAIADATSCPIILYNVPGRTGFDASTESILEMAHEIPSVAGVKEASGDLAKVADLVQGRPEGFAVYSGDDEWTLFFLALGADGVISVVSNVLPRLMSRLVRLGLEGELKEASQVHYTLLRAMRACFLDTNPIPAKAVLAKLGYAESTLRLPLVAISAEQEEVIMSEFLTALEAEEA
ncbi:MAG: 4-hydroxy-tetrahydrodipicolinate synthase [Rhodothermaceae bacterium]|nr:4-hydroxy-tetrahydrodipicolinate synthase [Bacteroidota bacterium]MXW14798.1 4-hydroxy-tetrahydrodipicolinate synthase [Rhodothermaceae bacterium]MDE2644714.1 4-hydroxy-tetrahydrodipicolinate synthase [Bacteroidota bacterium]MXW33015.1 4-hydroxy-tetrahydrodipicolinate synthase [Rhodothermaceae bacterium]MXX98210.1 4-hydroxy-tetrahydrodipicolinate synthase [Rhodothermaceae bacterium]